MTLVLALSLFACDRDEPTPTPVPPTDWTVHGDIAPGIMAPLGEPIPTATAEQLETFARGKQVGLHRFQPSEGLGPAFNTVFCLSCHERPVFGGSAGLYRSFFLSGRETIDGAFIPGESAGDAGGVIRLNYIGTEHDARPIVPETTNIVAQRNPIPFFGVGLIAELSDAAILRHADPDDADGDGISGRPNYDRGFVGRFGRKSQTVSIEGFIRGPIFNHLGVTTDPLTDAQRAALPVDSSASERSALADDLVEFGQAAAPDGPLTDDDGIADPELDGDRLFDLVSYAMLLAAPLVDAPTPASERGLTAFNDARCTDCHTPRLIGPRGPLHLYSDLLLHDMGPELADGLVAKDASGSEFRTQPLWGIASVGPYLHDGRAHTLHDAILAHGGEGSASQALYAAMDASTQTDLRAFLLSLGGASQYTPGLVPLDEPVAAIGTYGAPGRALNEAETERFLQGRTSFDTEFGFSDGAGGPRMNGDSCRACHFEPTIGGAGPLGVNVIRHGVVNASGEFVAPTVGTILHRLRRIDGEANRAQAGTGVYESRQTPHLYGLGLVDGIAEATIVAGADPEDLDGDGISGRVSYTDDGRVGRFGWKGSVPNIDEFVRDAVTMELGMTLPEEDGLTFGKLLDNDEVPDPELPLAYGNELRNYLRMLGPPPREAPSNAALADEGEERFETFGCASCHTPSLAGTDGPVPLYSDLLLHEILPPGAMGIEEAGASMREFRTAPLWGISSSGPYLHDGRAETLLEAIEGHDGEAAASREAVETASDADRAALLEFLGTL